MWGCPIFGALFAPKVGMYTLTPPAPAVACSPPPLQEPLPPASTPFTTKTHHPNQSDKQPGFFLSSPHPT
jgi:hypothetical protein